MALRYVSLSLSLSLSLSDFLCLSLIHCRSVLLLVKDPSLTSKLFTAAFGYQVRHGQQLQAESSLIELEPPHQEDSSMASLYMPIPIILKVGQLYSCTAVTPCISFYLHAPMLQEATTVSSLCTGYSPMLCLNVPNMEHSITTALQHGSMLDGPVKYPVVGKVRHAAEKMCV